MKTFRIYANDCECGVFQAETEQEAKDAAAQMKGYANVADMEKQLEHPPHIVAYEIEPHQ